MDRLVPPGWRVLGKRDFRRLWLAHAGSITGDGFHAIAVTWLVFETLGGGQQALAALGIAQLVPTLALGIPRRGSRTGPQSARANPDQVRGRQSG